MDGLSETSPSTEGCLWACPMMLVGLNIGSKIITCMADSHFCSQRRLVAFDFVVTFATMHQI